MSAWTPILQDISNFSETVQEYLTQSFTRLKTRRLSRASGDDWSNQLRQYLHSDPTYLLAVEKWLASSTGMETNNLPQETILKVFADVMILTQYSQSASAILLLAKTQVEIDRLRFGLNGVQQHQHNVHHDLTSYDSSDEEEETETEDEGENEELTEFLPLSDRSGAVTPVEEHGDKDPSPTNSPDHKRRRVANSMVVVEQLSFAEFDGLPIAARSAGAWNKSLRANPTLWPIKCKKWAHELRQALKEKSNTRLEPEKSAILYHAVLNVLRELRQVKKSVFTQKGWTIAVQESELYGVIHEWSDPRGLATWRSPFVVDLIRLNKIQETLLLVLLQWVPKKISSSWRTRTEIFDFKASGSRIQTGPELLKALKKNPEMIPKDASPSSIFFLLNLDNFRHACRHWLLFALEANGCNVTNISLPQSQAPLYSSLMAEISRLDRQQHLPSLGPVLGLIAKRTMEFKQMKKSVPNHILRNRKGIRQSCQTCSNLATSKRCTQNVEVKVDKVDNCYIGNGVTLAPSGCQMKPLPVPHSDPSSRTPKPIIHPNKLKLTAYGPDEEIIERCGMQLIRFVDKDEELIDFWLYNAFNDEIFDRLKNHHRVVHKVKAINRGKQFESYSEGKMIGKGARAASGGAPGDSFRFYTGMEAVTEEGVNALFNDGEDSMILSEAARIVAPSIYQQLEAATSSADRLGTSGACTFQCNNYTSPLHRDDDIGHGLCSQYDLQALSEYSEYSFIYADYHLYMKSRANSLWSFSGADMHGTMLPSTLPLPNQHGSISPPRVSNGSHKPATRSNKAAADRYARAHGTRRQIYGHWKAGL